MVWQWLWSYHDCGLAMIVHEQPWSTLVHDDHITTEWLFMKQYNETMNEYYFTVVHEGKYLWNKLIYCFITPLQSFLHVWLCRMISTTQVNSCFEQTSCQWVIFETHLISMVLSNSNATLKPTRWCLHMII